MAGKTGINTIYCVIYRCMLDLALKTKATKSRLILKIILHIRKAHAADRFKQL